MDVTIRLLNENDESALRDVADGVFDLPVRDDLLAAYLRDPRLHIAIAEADGPVVGMCSGISYFHPDKPAEFFLNELGVSPAFRRRGIGRKLMQTMIEHAKAIGSRAVWLATELDNDEANGLYQSIGLKPVPINMYEIEF